MTKKKCEACGKNSTEYYATCKGCYTHHVVNAVLAYVSTYRSRSSRIQMKLAIVNFYNEDDISDAKKLLVEAAAHIDVEIDQLAGARQNSHNRMAKEAEADDILDIFQKFDGSEDSANIKFYIDDVSKLPPAAPEAGGNMMSMFEAIARQAAQLQALQDAVAKVTDMAQNNTTNIQKMTTRSYASATMGGIQRKDARNPALSVAGSSYHGSKDGPGSKASGGRSEEVQLAESWRDIQVPLQDDGFTTVQPYRRNKQDQSIKIKPRPKANCGAGGGTGQTFAGPDTFYVQVTNVNSSVKDTDLKEFIEGKNEDIEIKEIKDTSSTGWDTKRFLLTFAIKDLEKVMKNEFWPEKIYFRSWYKSRGAKLNTE